MSYEYLPAVKGMSRADVERAAIDCLQKLAPQLLSTAVPTPIDHMLEFGAEKHFGIEFWPDNLPGSAEGITVPGSPVKILLDESVYDRMKNAEGRARFTAAHELGHALLHANQLQDELVSGKHELALYRTSTIPAYANPEWQANTFASYLLIPSDSLKLAVQQFGLNASDLARHFQVSYTAMSIRLRDSRFRG